MFGSKQIFRSLSGTALGAMPGVLIFVFGAPRVGVVVAVIGAFAGVLLSLPEVSLSRTMKLFAATLLKYNLPISDRIFNWVDEDSSETLEPTPLSDAFKAWVLADDVVDRKRWLVFTGLGVGLLAGAGITWHDLRAIQAGGDGMLLPLRNGQDSLLAQAIIGTIAFSIWTGSTIGVIAAPAFRRPILVGVILASFLFGMIAYAVGKVNGPGPIESAVFFSTGAAAFAILVAACFSCDDLDAN